MRRPVDTLSAIWKMNKRCRRIEKENLSDEEATRLFDAEAGPALLKVSKSPDWVQDRGPLLSPSRSPMTTKRR